MEYKFVKEFGIDQLSWKDTTKRIVSQLDELGCQVYDGITPEGSRGFLYILNLDKTYALVTCAFSSFGKYSLDVRVKTLDEFDLTQISEEDLKKMFLDAGLEPSK